MSRRPPAAIGHIAPWFLQPPWGGRWRDGTLSTEPFRLWRHCAAGVDRVDYLEPYVPTT